MDELRYARTEDDYTVEFTLEKDGDNWIITDFDSV